MTVALCATRGTGYYGPTPSFTTRAMHARKDRTCARAHTRTCACTTHGFAPQARVSENYKITYENAYNKLIHFLTCPSGLACTSAALTTVAGPGSSCAASAAAFAPAAGSRGASGMCSLQRFQPRCSSARTTASTSRTGIEGVISEGIAPARGPSSFSLSLSLSASELEVTR